MNLRPSGYEPDELPGCSIPRRRQALRTTSEIEEPPDTALEKRRLGRLRQGNGLKHDAHWLQSLAATYSSIA